ALLEWLDGSTFKMRVFPLEPRQEKRLLLSYTQRIPSLYGQATYRFPAGHSLGKVKHFSFRARLKGGATRDWGSPTHRLTAKREGGDLLLEAEARDAALDRDVVVEAQDGSGAAESARFSSAEHEGAKYLMLRYRPALPAAVAETRRDWVFLVE